MELQLINVILSYYLGVYDGLVGFGDEKYTKKFEDCAKKAYILTEHKFTNDPMYAIAWPQAKAMLQPK